MDRTQIRLSLQGTFQRPWFIGCAALLVAVGFSSSTTQAAAVTPDVVIQEVFSEYGIAAKILRPYGVLETESSRSDGRFSFALEGDPGFELELDRDYWVLVTQDAKKTNDVVGYIFNPKDEQSALDITSGESMLERSDAQLGQDPGFTKITREVGVVANCKVTWRRWSDALHLYSDCTFRMPLKDGSSEKTVKISISVTANTEERRKSLENCLSSLRLLNPTKLKRGFGAEQQPASGSGAPTGQP